MGTKGRKQTKKLDRRIAWFEDRFGSGSEAKTGNNATYHRPGSNKK